MVPSGINILHRAENFILAELPVIEAGVRHLVSITGQKAVLHRIVNGAEIISSEMNLPLVKAIADVANQVIGG